LVEIPKWPTMLTSTQCLQWLIPCPGGQWQEIKPHHYSHDDSYPLRCVSIGCMMRAAINDSSNNSFAYEECGPIRVGSLMDELAKPMKRLSAFFKLHQDCGEARGLVFTADKIKIKNEWKRTLEKAEWSEQIKLTEQSVVSFDV